LLFPESPLYPRLFQFGHFAIPAYGAFTAIALVAALAALRCFGLRLGLNANKIWNLGLIAILMTLIATRLILVAAYFNAFRRQPFWVLGLAGGRSSWIATLAITIGFVAAVLYALAEGLPLLRMLDCIAPSAALAIGLNRTGAFLAGLDYGLPTTHFWGVTYGSLIAAFWYRTPLGITLSPVQLYEAVASFVIFIVLLWWLPRRRQDGELWGIWLFLYGTVEFFLAFCRGANQTQWTFRQPVAVFMVIVSTAFLLQRGPGSNTPDYTVVDDSSRK
jgi:phosphatidylglycerol:prolipoprotein diacylglycerol transferase